MRLIDAEALKHKRVIAIYGNLEQGLEEREVVYVEDIDNAPTIEAKPIVHAHWEEWYPPKEFILTGEEKLFVCSNCTAKFETVENSKFCPWCGAQMDEKESD